MYRRPCSRTGAGIAGVCRPYAVPQALITGRSLACGAYENWLVLPVSRICMESIDSHGLHGFPWISMESMDFHGIHGFPWIPWISMDVMEIHGFACMHTSIHAYTNRPRKLRRRKSWPHEVFRIRIHGNPWNPWIPWKSMKSMDSMEIHEIHGIHGFPLQSNEIH